MTDVSIVRCADYERVEAALLEALAPFGGLDWVRPGMQVALKVNLVSGGGPERAINPHPQLVSVLCRLLAARGGRGHRRRQPRRPLHRALRRPRLRRLRMTAVEKVGARLNRDFSQRAVSFPEGKILRSFQYTAWMDGADATIDVCKLKTHGMMGMSCAVKNLFGVIPGTLKPEYHFRYPNPDDFADMLVDLAAFVRPPPLHLRRRDRHGRKRPHGGHAARGRRGAGAQNPHALDLAAAHIIGLRAQGRAHPRRRPAARLYPGGRASPFHRRGTVCRARFQAG